MSVEVNENSMENLLKDFDVKRISSGDILKGKIIDVNDKEVTVNINYAFDGVISKEELVVGDISPLEVVKPGDTIDVYVISPFLNAFFKSSFSVICNALNLESSTYPSPSLGEITYTSIVSPGLTTSNGEISPTTNSSFDITPSKA